MLNLWDEKLYKQSLFTRFIAFCGNIMAQKRKGLKHKYNGIDLKCSDFVSAFTNQGLYFSRNGGKPEEIFRPDSNLETFHKIFIPPLYKHEVFNVGAGVSRQKFTFVIDGNRYKTLN